MTKKILVSLICVSVGEEKWRKGKKKLYKFTHILLLKNNAQWKQKLANNQKKEKEKGNHLNLFKISSSAKTYKDEGWIQSKHFVVEQQTGFW